MHCNQSRWSGSKQWKDAPNEVFDDVDEDVRIRLDGVDSICGWRVCDDSGKDRTCIKDELPASPEYSGIDAEADDVAC